MASIRPARVTLACVYQYDSATCRRDGLLGMFLPVWGQERELRG
jgi:hypothetical protein